MKIYTNKLGHMTNMAAMPIHGKNLKTFFLRTNRPMTLKLVGSIVCASTTKVVQIMETIAVLGLNVA